MKLTELTVLVPSIGRESLVNTIASIPSECIVEVALDTVNTNIEKSLVHPNLHVTHVDFGMAGPTKEYLIGLVTTKWFMILDDDCYFNNDDFARFLQSIPSEVEDHISWISGHYKPANQSFNYRDEVNDYVVIEPEEYPKYYWDWLDGSRDDDYTLNHVYPTTDTLIKTEDWGIDKEDLDIEIYWGKYRHFEKCILDDAVPMTFFTSSMPGLMWKGISVWYDTPANSVSRVEYLSTEQLDDIYKTIQEFTELYFNEDHIHCRNDLWIRAIRNALKTTNYNSPLLKGGRKK